MPSRCHRSTTLFFLALAAVLTSSACRRDEIRTYEVPKGTVANTPSTAASPTLPPAMPTATPMAANSQSAPMSQAEADARMRDTAVTTATGPALAWTSPAHWTVGPERPMRKGTLLIPAPDGGPGGELAVTAFPGDVGGNLANVNRWRRQLGQPPITAAELAPLLHHLDVGSLHIEVVELTAPGDPPPRRMLAAIVPYAGSTWFFRLEGPDALVAAERENYYRFLQTLRPASGY